ncbi:hypothetical protein TNCV_1245811 [Trichonephila clavipes]|uniref:Uncharacterized protein n=1 Tax=Trichonephila clavipes TaxID=2585209 RepID=A0A8X6R9Z0_TRICX|nr:hypothetical protein TNCV_1245811 [Trichonephila clavipes]
MLMNSLPKVIHSSLCHFRWNGTTAWVICAFKYPKEKTPAREGSGVWLSLVGTRLLTLHGPQEIGLTSAGGKSRSCYCSDP